MYLIILQFTLLGFFHQFFCIETYHYKPNPKLLFIKQEKVLFSKLRLKAYSV